MTKVFKKLASWTKATASEARARAEAREYGRVDGCLQKLREGTLLIANLLMSYEVVVIAIALSEGVMPIRRVDPSTIVGGFLGAVVVLTGVISAGYFLVLLPISTCRKRETLWRFIVLEIGGLVIAAAKLLRERADCDSLVEFERQRLIVIDGFRTGWIVLVGIFILLSIAVKVPGYVRRTRQVREAREAKKEER